MANTNTTDFFENLGKSLSRTADKVAKKTDEFLTIQKLKGKISTLERKTEDTFLKIGEAVYQREEEGQSFDQEITDLCKEIVSLRAAILVCRDEIAAKRGNKICPTCGAHIPREARFCMQCGGVMPEDPFPEEEEDPEEAGQEKEEAAGRDPEGEGSQEEASQEEVSKEEVSQEAGAKEEGPVEADPKEEAPEQSNAEKEEAENGKATEEV